VQWYLKAETKAKKFGKLVDDVTVQAWATLDADEKRFAFPEVFKQTSPKQIGVKGLKVVADCMFS
jgi:hypothetical protein